MSKQHLHYAPLLYILILCQLNEVKCLMKIQILFRFSILFTETNLLVFFASQQLNNNFIHT